MSEFTFCYKEHDDDNWSVDKTVSIQFGKGGSVHLDDVLIEFHRFLCAAGYVDTHTKLDLIDVDVYGDPIDDCDLDVKTTVETAESKNDYNLEGITLQEYESSKKRNPLEDPWGIIGRR